MRVRQLLGKKLADEVGETGMQHRDSDEVDEMGMLLVDSCWQQEYMRLYPRPHDDEYVPVLPVFKSDKSLLRIPTCYDILSPQG